MFHLLRAGEAGDRGHHDGHIEAGLAARQRDGASSPRNAAALVRTLAEIIQYAHDNGVLHRDLKPQNVLVDRNGVVKITDFGLAKRLDGDSSLTTSGQVLGTPSYMPPEQAAGKVKDIGRAADIYALGAILYWLLTGRPPFQGATVANTLMQVLQVHPVPPRRLNRSIPLGLETICLKCLEKDPRRRFVSAAALADELGRWLKGKWLSRGLCFRALTVLWCAELVGFPAVTLLLLYVNTKVPILSWVPWPLALLLSVLPWASARFVLSRLRKPVS